VFIFSQLSTALMSFSIGDVSPRFPFLTCRCYGSKKNLALLKEATQKSLEVIHHYLMCSPVLQTAPMINTCIHPQMFGEPG